jgi:DnaJ-class molecular chaperone
MSPMTKDPFGGVPEGMRWCPHCNGYGSSLKEDAERCTHCGGSGLVTAADHSEGDASGQGQGPLGPAA